MRNVMKQICRYLFVLILPILLIQCKKEDNVLPDFSIVKPYENSQWSVYDSIPFEISNNSTRIISEVKVCIVNEDYMPVSEQIVYYPSTQPWNYQGVHYINNSNLESGVYFFKVTMLGDNGNSATRYRRIYIDEIPLRSLALIVVAQKSANEIAIYRIDSMQTSTELFSVFSDYSSSELYSKSAFLYLCGRYTGPLAAYDLNNSGALVWKEDALLNPPFPYFEKMNYDGKYIVTGYTDNRVIGRQTGGTQNFVYEMDDFYPRRFLRHYDSMQQKDYLVVGAAHFSGLSWLISVFYDLSYSNMQFLLTDWEPEYMFSTSYDEIYMFGNLGEQGVMRIYKISENNTYTLHTLPTGKLLDVVEIRMGVYLISTEQGLMLYQKEFTSLTPYGSFTPGGKLCYDQDTRKCFYALNDQIEIFDFYTYNPEGTVNLGDSVLQMHILYNK